MHAGPVGSLQGMHSQLMPQDLIFAAALGLGERGFWSGGWGGIVLAGRTEWTVWNCSLGHCTFVSAAAKPASVLIPFTVRKCCWRHMLHTSAALWGMLLYIVALQVFLFCQFL